MLMDIAFCETIETKNVEFVNVFFCERIMVFKRWLDLEIDNFNVDGLQYKFLNYPEMLQILL